MRMLKVKRSKTNIVRHGVVVFLRWNSPGWNRCFWIPLLPSIPGVAPVSFSSLPSHVCHMAMGLLVYLFRHTCTFIPWSTE
jgi:hypothetical protein